MKKFLLLISLLLIASIAVRINTDESGQTRGIMNQGSENYNKKFFPVTQEEIDAVETENRVVYMDFSVRHGVDSQIYITVICDNGCVYYFEIPPAQSNDWLELKYYSKEYIWDYLNGMDLKTDIHVTDKGYISDTTDLNEYIVRLHRVKSTRETIVQNIDTSFDCYSEGECYGIIYDNSEPEFIFLYKEDEGRGEITKNADAEARKAFNVLNDAWNQIIWEE